MKKYCSIVKSIIVFLASFLVVTVMETKDVKAEFLLPSPNLTGVPEIQAPVGYEAWELIGYKRDGIARGDDYTNEFFWCYNPEEYSFTSTDGVEYEIKVVKIIGSDEDREVYGKVFYDVLRYDENSVYACDQFEKYDTPEKAMEGFKSYRKHYKYDAAPVIDNLISHGNSEDQNRKFYGLRRVPSSKKKEESNEDNKDNSGNNSSKYNGNTSKTSKLTEEELQELIEALKALGIDYYAEEGKEEKNNSENTKKQREEENLKAPDKDTNKSVLPSKSLIAEETTNTSTFVDLKAHEMSKTDSVNQKFLADSFASAIGKEAKILLEYSVYPSRDLSVTENGSKTSLTVSNVPSKEGQNIFAVGYNQTDGAYYMSGFVDKEKKATFSSFKLRPASNITLFECENTNNKKK